jgi:hypothetical protein
MGDREGRIQNIERRILNREYRGSNYVSKNHIMNQGLTTSKSDVLCSMFPALVFAVPYIPALRKNRVPSGPRVTPIVSTFPNPAGSSQRPPPTSASQPWEDAPL